jgi:hypothetical protein
MTDAVDPMLVRRVVGWGLAGDPGSLGPVVLDEEASCRLRLWADQTRLDSPDPPLRTVGDVDLLVRRRQFGAALDVLAAAGHRRVELAPARWWERRYGRAATLKGAAGMEIDVHASIAVGYFGVGSTTTRCSRPAPNASTSGASPCRRWPGRPVCWRRATPWC